MSVYLSPGVYIDEVPSGPVPIAGVATSAAAMIGLTQRGPVNVPTLVTNPGEYAATFGGTLDPDAAPNLNAEFGAVPYAASGFFMNGGQQLYVTRVAPSNLATYTVTYPLQGVTGEAITIAAADGGAWANPEFGFYRSKYQQTDGLQITFAQDSAPLLKVATANSTTQFTLASTMGLYVGAVLQHVQDPTEYAVVTAIAGQAVTVSPGFGTAPAANDTLQVEEISIAVSLLQAGQTIVAEMWHNLTINPSLGNSVLNVIGAIPTGTQTTTPGASNLIRVSLPAGLNFGGGAGTTPAFGPASGATGTVTTQGDDALSSLTVSDYNELFAGNPAGSLDSDDPAARQGIYTFRNIRGMLMIAMPGMTDVETAGELIALCENEVYKFAVLDPAGTDSTGDWHYVDASPSDVQTQRGNFDTEYAALYYPWIVIEDPDPPNPNAPGTVNIPPSGHMMGIYAATDINRGVYKAPANVVVNGAIAFSHYIDNGTQDVLNPIGVNCLRDFRVDNRGLRVWGARTMSSDTQWTYISTRRLFQYIEASIDYGTQWVVFEPNNEMLWARVRQSVTDFLTDTWRSGALMGSKPAEAFYVTCDTTTMSASDLENGRLICEIGIAPTFPAEFVIFQISQWTGSAQGS